MTTSLGSGDFVVRHLSKTFVRHGGSGARCVRAVDDVSFRIPKGASVGLVGESGCGKSTVARTILRLIEPDSGSILFDGIDVRAAKGATLRALRRRMQIVFQDPYSSLNPRRTIRQTLEEPLRVHLRLSSKDIREKAEAAMLEVGLPREALERYPHEFSGGQRQRIGIARALVLDPELVVADEAVSALDVSVQAQILRLLEGLRERRGLSFLFVSHDLGVVRHFCDRVSVMYLGRIIEEGPTADVLDRPLHPYTRLLRDSYPVPDPRARRPLIQIVGEVPSAANPPPGCGFHPRCARAEGLCSVEKPQLETSGDGRFRACYFPETSEIAWGSLRIGAR
ncbi:MULTISPECIES: oligopeptide/dipeptide ABC transporter ATP-binding protein [unclassified Bradyrhizobium]|uniref:ABC transporter ATP-binding protein n=1 Tax=unclassified Bradyrhizobium TaxID=2631580 RepID=UPI002916A67C|nr:MULTISPECIES: oligopeptide/dipeptide ABC transporter ATP-binding protein [unclassified Bradyrhizobium]